MALKCAYIMCVISLYAVNTNPHPVTNLFLKQYIFILFLTSGSDTADCTNNGLFTAFGFMVARDSGQVLL